MPKNLCIDNPTVNGNKTMRIILFTNRYFNFGRFFYSFRSVHPVG